jgi:predicted transcriptional regulator
LSLETPGTESEIAERVGTPIFRVRSNLREMIEFGLVREKEGVYQLVGSCDDDWDDPIPSPF